MSLNAFITSPTVDHELTPGIFFMSYGPNGSTFRAAKKLYQGQNVIFLELCFIPNMPLHPLTPSYEISRMFKYENPNAEAEYIRYIAKYQHRVKELLKIREQAKTHTIYLVGFNANPMKDFRWTLKHLIENQEGLQ